MALLFTVGLTFAACNRDGGGKTAQPTDIARLDSVLSVYAEMDEASRLKTRSDYAAELSAYMPAIQEDTVSDEALVAWGTGNVMSMFGPEVRAQYADLKTLKQHLGQIEQEAAAQGVELGNKRYVTAIWANLKSIIINDTVLMVALNHYLGADNEAYRHWPEYKRALKRPDMIEYDIVEASLATRYPYSLQGEQATLLSRMIYDGVLTEAKMRLVPDAKIENALGFSQSQLSDIQSHRAFIWAKLVDGKLLFSTDADVMARLTEPAPASPLISPDAPGRAVRLNGYEIVRQYLDAFPQTKLSEMLKPDFYAGRQTLSQAGYAPVK